MGSSYSAVGETEQSQRRDDPTAALHRRPLNQGQQADEPLVSDSSESDLRTLWTPLKRVRVFLLCVFVATCVLGFLSGFLASRTGGKKQTERRDSLKVADRIGDGSSEGVGGSVDGSVETGDVTGETAQASQKKEAVVSPLTLPASLPFSQRPEVAVWYFSRCPFAETFLNNLESQSKNGADVTKCLLEDFGIDAAKLKTCQREGKVVQEMKRTAKSKNINGSPIVPVNGTQISHVNFILNEWKAVCEDLRKVEEKSGGQLSSELKFECERAKKDDPMAYAFG
uniref:Uncharacterized protein n=1 Tax=Chromera velia CCMP2878 TaxID=1169474 RepID=A0A0G4H2Q9_9ALVE|eukprot:Cvel_24471.t1-p1 / transcript=Cvel_24471.t1 / gene=Cvel_24471 / organism=Chromera_velia_CCMP2878 / gene_product=hypothetical protein / transcript_product=hypothetical protein / location=Cvel_scaffold2648:18031-19495(+) / protein_length=282 / sequence_SO=supercontig / SO=protein_coding / is_pseudo=false